MKIAVVIVALSIVSVGTAMFVIVMNVARRKSKLSHKRSKMSRVVRNAELEALWNRIGNPSQSLPRSNEKKYRTRLPGRWETEHHSEITFRVVGETR